MRSEAPKTVASRMITGTVSEKRKPLRMMSSDWRLVSA